MSVGGAECHELAVGGEQCASWLTAMTDVTIGCRRRLICRRLARGWPVGTCVLCTQAENLTMLLHWPSCATCESLRYAVLQYANLCCAMLWCADLTILPKLLFC